MSLKPASMQRDDDGLRILVVGAYILTTMGGGHWFVEKVLNSGVKVSISHWVGKEDVRQLLLNDI
jgi:hypothetical protein